MVCSAYGCFAGKVAERGQVDRAMETGGGNGDGVVRGLAVVWAAEDDVTYAAPYARRRRRMRRRSRMRRRCRGRCGHNRRVYGLGPLQSSRLRNTFFRRNRPCDIGRLRRLLMIACRRLLTIACRSIGLDHGIRVVRRTVLHPGNARRESGRLRSARRRSRHLHALGMQKKNGEARARSRSEKACATLPAVHALGMQKKTCPITQVKRLVQLCRWREISR